jgi:hypothetical protein
LVTGTPVRADLFGVPEFFSSQGEIRVPVRRTTREPIEATCRLLATSREFGATSTNYPAAYEANASVVAGAAHEVGW